MEKKRGDIIRINVSVSDDMNGNLDLICSRWGCSKSDLVSIVLGQYLDCFDKKAFMKSWDDLSRAKNNEKHGVIDLKIN